MKVAELDNLTFTFLSDSPNRTEPAVEESVIPPAPIVKLFAAVDPVVDRMNTVAPVELKVNEFAERLALLKETMLF
ncbi:MAG: hypothetical protein ACKON7_02990 [Planctomycetaceae bacterium]